MLLLGLDALSDNSRSLFGCCIGLGVEQDKVVTSEKCRLEAQERKTCSGSIQDMNFEATTCQLVSSSCSERMRQTVKFSSLNSSRCSSHALLGVRIGLKRFPALTFMFVISRSL